MSDQHIVLFETKAIHSLLQDFKAIQTSYVCCYKNPYSGVNRQHFCSDQRRTSTNASKPLAHVSCDYSMPLPLINGDSSSSNEDGWRYQTLPSSHDHLGASDHETNDWGHASDSVATSSQLRSRSAHPHRKPRSRQLPFLLPVGVPECSKRTAAVLQGSHATPSRSFPRASGDFWGRVSPRHCAQETALCSPRAAAEVPLCQPL